MLLEEREKKKTGILKEGLPELKHKKHIEVTHSGGVHVLQMKTSYIHSVIKCLLNNLFDTGTTLGTIPKKNYYGDKTHF